MATSDIPASPPPPPRRATSASNPPPVEAANAEPSNAEAANAEPSNGGTANAEPANAEAANAEPSNGGTANAEPANAEPANAEGAPAQATNAEPAKAEGAKLANQAASDTPVAVESSPTPAEQAAAELEDSPDSEELPTIVRSEPPLAAMMNLARADKPETRGTRSSPPPAAVLPAAAPAPTSPPGEISPPAAAALSAAATGGLGSAMLPPPPAFGTHSLPSAALPAVAPLPLPSASTGPTALPTPARPPAVTAALPAPTPPPGAALPALTPPPAARAKSVPPSEDEPESATFVQRPNTGSETHSAGDGLGAIGRDAQRTFEQAVEYLDTHDGWVPIRFRGRIRGSVLTLSGALVALALVGGVVALVKAGSSRSQTTEVASVAARVENRAAPAVFAASPTPSSPALKGLEKDVAAPVERPSAASAPSTGADEGALLLDSARSFAWQGRDAEAVTLIERALLRNPELRSDPRVREVLLRTAHSDDRASSAATFALLEGPMADTGAELMYEVSIARVGKDSARKRAQSFLRSKQFAKNAALPLFIAVKLRQAKSCEDKHALLTLAAGGGKQTLEYLRELQSHTTCAPDDLVNCYPCLRADSRLNDAIAAIEQRTKG